MPIEEIKSEAKKLRDATREQTLGLITAALSLVAGLAWNDAIASAIKEIFPAGASGIFVKFLYAGVVTCFVVVLTFVARRILERRS